MRITSVHRPRSRIILSLLALSLLAGLAACKDAGGSAPASKGIPSAEILPALEALAERACACKDEACATAVRGEVTTLGQNAGVIAEGDMPKLQSTQTRLDTCLVELNPVYHAYKKVIDPVCACKDKACAQKASAAISTWAADFKASGTKIAGSDAQMILAYGAKAKPCLEKFGLPIPQ